VIIVAGTNGKGSTCAMLESIAHRGPDARGLHFDGEMALARRGDTAVVGSANVVNATLKKRAEAAKAGPEIFPALDGAVITVGIDRETGDRLVGMLSEKKVQQTVRTKYTSSTKFTESGIKRTTLSPFGLIGTMIVQFSGS